MTLSIVNPFATPYEAWSMRAPTPDEIMQNGNVLYVRDQFEETISDMRAAATRIARVHEDARLTRYIRSEVTKCHAFKAWRAAMPKRTPRALSRYQKHYKTCDLEAADAAVDLHGALLPVGQYLVHVGHWLGGAGIVTTRPLSTSLCPQAALRNADHNGKAYQAGRVDIWLLRIKEPRTKAFIYDPNDQDKGHEVEVLLGSGATLTFRCETLVRDDYPAGGMTSKKSVPLYILNIEVS